MDKIITAQELDCIRFYMGDPAIVNRGDFRGGSKAYNTINALMHDGIVNELDKLREGRVLEIYDRAHLISYLDLAAHIYAAMVKFRAQHHALPRVSYRVDRMSDAYALREKGFLEGFYSTCKHGFLPDYAASKAHVALMEIVRDDDVPCLDFAVLFQGYYAKPEEAEILLPFHAVVHRIEEVPLSPEEQGLIDLHGNPPEGKFRIHLGPPDLAGTDDADALWAAITDEQAVQQVRTCLSALSRRQGLSEADMAFYCAWKDQIRCWLYCVQRRNHALST